MQAERGDEEKEAMERALDAARDKGLAAFEESLTFWAPDGSGKVLSWREFEAMSRGAAEEGGGLPHPKVGGFLFDLEWVGVDDGVLIDACATA